MTKRRPGRVAILYPGDQQARREATADNNRFSTLFAAFADGGIQAEPAVYHDDLCPEVREQLMRVDGVLVWVNPIHDGRDRSILDSMLRDVAAAGVFVSTHPDVILALGTKEVLYRTRALGWGCDTRLVRSLDQLRRELPTRLASGKTRVLKQNRGNGGNGVWKIRLPMNDGAPEGRSSTSLPGPGSVVRVHHAQRGCIEEEMTLADFLGRCEGYFSAGGPMIDQEYQQRLPEGMIRCYLVHGRVAGFGHQALNALCPAPPGKSPAEPPQPGPRLYHPPSKPEFQALKQRLEREWVPAVQRLLGITTESLPVLWDCDFLLGPKDSDGSDTHVLCEINVSSVAPYPESAVPAIVDATALQLQRVRQRRG